jgi:16S rRNA (adenine1518-N6/adenine1519-N6)-dimethyltransferase
LNYQSNGWFKIPRGCFFPAPDVDSACITLVRRQRPALPAGFQKTFVRLVKLAFGQRRKMMFKLLKAAWPVEALENAFAQTGIDRNIRAEAVSLAQFEALTQCLTPPAPAA